MGLRRQRMLWVGCLAIRVYWPRAVDYRSDCATSRPRMVGFGLVHLRIRLGHSWVCRAKQAESAAGVTDTITVFHSAVGR